MLNSRDVVECNKRGVSVCEPLPPDRSLWFPGSSAPEWLDGSLPGDFGFKLLGLELGLGQRYKNHGQLDTRPLKNLHGLKKEELQRTNLEWYLYKEKMKENQEKIKLNNQLPYFVGNIIEVLFCILVISLTDQQYF